MYVWTYWEGERWPHIDVCLRTMEEVCHTSRLSFQCVTPENRDELVGDVLHPNYKLLPQPALKADCIRAALLYKYGGWWLDADTILFSDPTVPNSLYPEANAIYMVWDNPPRRALNGYIYMHSRCWFAESWVNRINHELETDHEAIGWCGVGETLLTPMLTGNLGAVQISRRFFLPIDIDSSVEEFFKPGDWRTLVDPGAIAFGLNHSWFVYHKPQQMRPEAWHNSDLLIHELLRDHSE